MDWIKIVFAALTFLTLAACEGTYGEYTSRGATTAYSNQY